jgi:hypothetical protein
MKFQSKKPSDANCRTVKPDPLYAIWRGNQTRHPVSAVYANVADRNRIEEFGKQEFLNLLISRFTPGFSSFQEWEAGGAAASRQKTWF